jgi:hypothetical protein
MIIQEHSENTFKAKVSEKHTKDLRDNALMPQ